MLFLNLWENKMLFNFHQDCQTVASNINRNNNIAVILSCAFIKCDKGVFLSFRES